MINLLIALNDATPWSTVFILCAVLLVVGYVLADAEGHYRRRRHGYHAYVEQHSVSGAGVELITMVWRYWLAIHAEVMTYRRWSRNGASGRARPIRLVMKQVLWDPAGPVFYGRNQRGMEAQVELVGWRLMAAYTLFYAARFPALLIVVLMNAIPLHKQVANRLLGPWVWMELVITGNPESFENCWRQRCHPAAQPEFQEVAYKARDALGVSTPTLRMIHCPFVYNHEEGDLINFGHGIPPTVLIQMVSTARCARVSYRLFDGTTSLKEDVNLYYRLHLDQRDDEVPHTSPAEHTAEAMDDPLYVSGNIHGWRQYREVVDPYFIYPDGSMKEMAPRP